MILRTGLSAFIRLFLAAGVILYGRGESPSKAASSITIYTPQAGTPAAIPNFINPADGCDWWGVGGQVFNEAGRPETGLVVRITGTLDGWDIDTTAITGSSLAFGPGGYDFYLATYLPNTVSLRLQLFDTSGRPQSAQLPVPLYRTCSQNLLVYNMRQRTYDEFYHLPITVR